MAHDCISSSRTWQKVERAIARGATALYGFATEPPWRPSPPFRLRSLVLKKKSDRVSGLIRKEHTLRLMPLPFCLISPLYDGPQISPMGKQAIACPSVRKTAFTAKAANLPFFSQPDP